MKLIIKTLNYTSRHCKSLKYFKNHEIKNVIKTHKKSICHEGRNIENKRAGDSLKVFISVKYH